MSKVKWDPETGERLEELDDEWERDNVYAPVEEPFRPIPEADVPLSERQKEYGKSQVDLCRLTLADLENKKP